MLRNQMLSLAVLFAAVFCTAVAFAQTGQFPNNYYQGTFMNSMQATAASIYAQGQTCANGSCSKRSSPSSVAATVAASTISHSAYAAPQPPTASKNIQPTQLAYYPASISVGYSPRSASHTTAPAYRPMATTRSYYGAPVGYSSSCH